MYTLGSVKLKSDLGLAAGGSSCGLFHPSFFLEKKDVTVILNKKIGKKTAKSLGTSEGCLSVPEEQRSDCQLLDH